MRLFYILILIHICEDRLSLYWARVHVLSNHNNTDDYILISIANTSTEAACAIACHRHHCGAFRLDNNNCNILKPVSYPYEHADKVFVKTSTCHDLSTESPSAVYTITLNQTFTTDVFCDMTSRGGGWIVIHNRFDGRQDFYKNWTEYKNGFGLPSGEYWIGNDNLNMLTSTQTYELLIEMEDAYVKRYAKYATFSIGTESDLYRLRVTGFEGNTTDRLTQHDNKVFSTYDVDNDTDGNKNCAEFHHGAWWYTSCHGSNLNGEYMFIPNTNSNWSSMCWRSFDPSADDLRPLKAARMMIPPV